MNHLVTRTCARCRRALAADAFYVPGNRPDPYCKDCRRLLMRLRRKAAGLDPGSADRPRRLIAAADDPALRLRLILEAKQEARRSVLRKRRRDIEEDYAREEG